MIITYTIKKHVVGAQKLVAETIALSKNQQLTVNALLEKLNSNLKRTEIPIQRGSLLRHVQELETKNVLFVKGKEGKSNIYTLNKESLEKD